MSDWDQGDEDPAERFDAPTPAEWLRAFFEQRMDKRTKEVSLQDFEREVIYAVAKGWNWIPGQAPSRR